MNSNSLLRIVIIGTGQLAGHLALTFMGAGHTIVQIVGRNYEKTKQLAENLALGFVLSFDEIDTDADVYLLAVSDDAIAEVVEKLPVLKGICVHASGSIGMDVFKDKFTSFGVFYPLQTFSQGRFIDFQGVPIFIEANSPICKGILFLLANSISGDVVEVCSEDRRKLHLAAVFVSNFVNALFSMGNEILHNTNLSFELLKPLILETVYKAFETDPESSQTGPAKRGDKGTMHAHLNLLNNKPELARLYDQFSKYISTKYNVKDYE